MAGTGKKSGGMRSMKSRGPTPIGHMVHQPGPQDTAVHRGKNARAKTTGLENVTGKRIKSKPSVARGRAALRKATGT